MAELRSKAADLYIKSRLPIDEIARALNVSEATVYRWKNKEAETGNDWDKLKQDFQPLPVWQLWRRYYSIIQLGIEKMEEKPELINDSKAADAMVKHISNLVKILPKDLLYSAAAIIMEIIKDFLSRVNPKLWEQFVPHLPEIEEAIKAKIFDV